MRLYPLCHAMSSLEWNSCKAEKREWQVIAGKTTSKQIAQQVTAQRLAATSELFEDAELTQAKEFRDFVLRINTLVHSRRPMDSDKVPEDLARAIRANGVAKPAAELVLFGDWLLGGRPGLKQTPGRQPDYSEILKCVAACMVGLYQRARLKHQGTAADNGTLNFRSGRKKHIKPSSRKSDITKDDLSYWWERVFDEKRSPERFDANLRTMRRILPAYLEHLKSRKVMHGGKTVTRSPEIQAVLKAKTGRHEANPVQSQPSAPEVSARATPSPFTISLGYSSSLEQRDYRGSARRDAPPSTLTYEAVPPSSTSPNGKIVLEPKIDVRENFKVNALIDRIAILLTTSSKINDITLKTQIEEKTGRTVLVRDLTKKKNERHWGAPLPEPDLTKSTGYHFAILIQDPEPEMLVSILAAIRDGPRINGAVTLHMIEVSVDFYPKTDDPKEAIRRREQMVGLLQRHHWVPQSSFLDADISKPRHTDARQIYRDPNQPTERKKKIRYLFPDNSNTWDADRTLDFAEIRARILTSNTGEDLYLNSTLAKGGKHAAHHVTIQHKIADQRNRNNHTMTVLPDNERRARVEVTLSGIDTLKQRDLGTIDDLGKISFRKLTKPFLSFKLGVVDPCQHLLEDAQAQMHTRGVYGLGLRHRARALEGREQMRTRGEKLPRNLDREGRGLRAWKEMNDVTGKALDELTRRWRRFSQS
ncbi:MAG: hypothetical protein RIG84_05945 [Roseovarius sp.]